jgi:hypothetical protein
VAEGSGDPAPLELHHSQVPFSWQVAGVVHCDDIVHWTQTWTSVAQCVFAAPASPATAPVQSVSAPHPQVPVVVSQTVPLAFVAQSDAVAH